MEKYPDEWSALSQPRVRSELMEFLKSAMDATQIEDRDELKALVHFIFDDHDFASDAASLIGVALFDAQEAELLNRFVNALDRGVGPGKAWPKCIHNTVEICTSAKAALGALTKRGIRTFIP